MLQNNWYFTLEIILPFTSSRQSIFSTFPIIKLSGVTVYDIGVTGFSSSVVSDLVKVSLVRVLAALFWDQWLRPPWSGCSVIPRAVCRLIWCRAAVAAQGPVIVLRGRRQTSPTYFQWKFPLELFDWQWHSSWRPTFLPSVVFSLLIHGKRVHIFCLV